MHKHFVALAALALCAVAAPAMAQSVNDENQVLLSQIQTDKRAIVLKTLALSDEESKAFIPIFDEYQAEQKKIADRAIATLDKFAANYDSMTEDAARDITREWIGIEDDRRLGGQRHANQFLGALSDPQTRPKQDSVLSPVGEQPLEPTRIVGFAHHDRGELGGVDGNRIARRGHRHEPRADSQCAARAAPRRPRAKGRARDHDGMTTRIFVSFGFRPGKMRKPQSGLVDEGIRLDFGKDGLGDADIGNAQRAAIEPPGQEKMAGLEAEERHRGGCANRGPPHLAGCAVDAARHVDRDNWQTRGIQGLDQLRELALDGPRKAGAKQRINDDVGPGEDSRPERLALAGKTASHGGSVVRQTCLVAVETEPDLVAALEQMAGGNEAVSTIVAGTAKHQNGFLIGKAARNLPGDGAARVLHQCHARHTALDDETVGTRHLFSG